MIKLGWRAGPEYGPLDLLEGAVIADQYGFDLMDVSHSSSSEDNASQQGFNWAWLGAAAAKTERIHLGPGVPCGALRCGTAGIAEAAQTLAVVTEGRAYITIHLMEDPREPALEENWADENEQHDMAAEAIDLIRRLWSGQPVTFRGNYFHARGASLNVQCDQSMPIYVALQAPGDAYFAGYYGDGLITSAGMRPVVYQRILKEFERGAREAGKDPDQMPRMIELPVAYQRFDEPERASGTQPWRSGYFASVPCKEAAIPVTAGKPGKTLSDERDQRGICTSHDPGQHAECVQEFIALGFDTLLFRSIEGDPLAFLRDYGRDVLPRIRAHHLGDF